MDIPVEQMNWQDSILQLDKEVVPLRKDSRILVNSLSVPLIHLDSMLLNNAKSTTYINVLEKS